MIPITLNTGYPKKRLIIKLTIDLIIEVISLMTPSTDENIGNIVF